MTYPAFYDQAPRISVRDPLADFLGAAEDGLMEYRYLDAVHLAGHSCPTVAGAWLLTRAALRALYGDATPERGGVTVRMPSAQDEGVTGVMAQVFTLVTGAAADNGFHGIGGHFVRQGLLSYTGTTPGEPIMFTRRDNGKIVGAELDLRAVPPVPNLRGLMVAAINPAASATQRRTFADAWQGRVRTLLLDHADDARVVRLSRLN
ncbi:MAG: hypothetical protein ABI300_03900 [Rhodanobacter sp.]